MRHSFESHSSLSTFSFICGINSCVRSFSKFSALKSHIGRNHGDVNLDSVNPALVNVNAREIDHERVHEDTVNGESDAWEKFRD